MANIGRYNRRLTYQILTGTVDTPTGGTTPTYDTAKTIWCSAKKLSQKETIFFGLSLGESTFQFKLRYEIGNQFDQTTKLTYEGVELRVISVNEIDEYKREVVVTANERTD